MDILPQKRCSKCERDLPATPKYFYRNRSRYDGYQTYCKQCLSGIDPDGLQANVPDGYKYCGKCQRVLPATIEYFHRDKQSGDNLHTPCKECRLAYRLSHLEEQRAYDAKWHKDNAERCARISREYRQSERGTIAKRARAHNRRARKRNAEGSHTTEELYQQLQRQKGKCHYCHVKLGKGRESWNGDHIIPLSRGGTNYIDNIVIVCPSCNFKKGSKLPHEWTDGGRLL